VPIAASVPSSSHVPASVNRGVPIVLDEPKHPVSIALRTFADKYIINDAMPSLSASPDSERMRTPDSRSAQPKLSRRLFRKGAQS
jgi:pilus assembly protein CpaE